MMRLCAAVGSLTLMALACLALPAGAQSKPSAGKFSGPFSYDVSKEITLNGTVSSLLTKPQPGMIMGAHLLFATTSGQVDASLGGFALRGKNALSASAGQQVAVTGVLKTINNRQVFLARTVKVDGQVFTIRNEHGMALSPQTRERLNLSSGQKGVQQ